MSTLSLTPTDYRSCSMSIHRQGIETRHSSWSTSGHSYYSQHRQFAEGILNSPFLRTPEKCFTITTNCDNKRLFVFRYRIIQTIFQGIGVTTPEFGVFGVFMKYPKNIHGLLRDIYSLPVTQVTVERLFSNLKFIKNEHILFLRYNFRCCE